MTPEQAQKLREPFAPELIGKLPKPTKRDNPKGRCKDCGGYHGLPAVHLDYVGHAAITDRLLQVDPGWTWEPMASDERGFPLLDAKDGLWIRLTICGVTRIGYGDETNGKGMKEIIGDALRNGAMRFGVGLDLWSKEDLNSEGGSSASPGDLREPGSPSNDPDKRAPSNKNRPESAPRSAPSSLPAEPASVDPPHDEEPAPAGAVISEAQRRKLFAIKRDKDLTDDQLRNTVYAICGVTSTKTIPSAKFQDLLEALA